MLGAEHRDRDPALSGPYDEVTPFHEPLVLFAYLSAVTTRIAFATGVLVLPQRQTVLVAKQAAELAVLSGDRLRLGAGWGGTVEYAGLNESFGNRGMRQEEQIETLRQLWTSPLVDMSGRWHRIDRAALMPRPSRRIPIWLGGFGAKSAARAARLADGFMFTRLVPTRA